MLADLLNRRADAPLWMPALRARFEGEEGSRPLILRLERHDGARRDYACALPRWQNEQERALVRDFLFAEVYNILTVNSGRELRVFFDTEDGELRDLAAELGGRFGAAGEPGGGFDKLLHISERIGGGCGLSAFPVAGAAAREERSGL